MELHVERELKQYFLEGKALFGYTNGTDEFVTYSQFLKEFGLDSVPPATLQRKKRAVIGSQAQEERYCPAKYLRLFKSVHAVSEGARKASVITLTQAQSLLALLAGRRLKHVQSRASAEWVQSTAMETEGAPMQPEFDSTQIISHSLSEGSPENGEALTGTDVSPADKSLSEETSAPAEGAPMQPEFDSAEDLTSPTEKISDARNEGSTEKECVLPAAEVKITGIDASPAEESLLQTSEVTSAPGRRRKSQKVNLKLHKELNRELAEMRGFYTRDYNSKRDGSKLSEVTIDKTLDKIQVFLGYAEDSGKTPELTDLADMELLDHFFTHKQESGAKPGTIASYGQGLLHGLKYVEAVRCTSTGEVQTYVRQVVSRSQREAENSRDKSWQDLSARKKWLHWEEIIEVLKSQRDAYESVTTPQARAKESQDYAQLLLYTTIPPARAQEYRTLLVNMYDASAEKPHSKSLRENTLHIAEDGSTAKLEIRKYKNCTYQGKQTIDITNIDYLVPHLLDYIKRDRSVLLQRKPDHHYLFMDKTGDPYTESRWTLHIQHIFEKHSGSAVGPNQIRSSFVTYLLDGQVSVSDSLARDVASAMRHSVNYQRRVYDRRTSQDRTAEAVKFASNLTACALGGTTNAVSFDEDDDAYEVGDIVALVDRISTPSKPQILLAKILRTYPRKREALLAHLAPLPNTRKKYQLTVGRDSWTESYDALIFPIDVVYDEMSNMYTLRTTPAEIYKSCLPISPLEA